MRLVILFCAMALTIFASPGARSDEHGEAAAQAAAVKWLALLDTGQFAASWTAAAALFRSSMPQEAWQAKVAHAREPLGALKSRKLQSATFARTLPGAPDGAYVVLQFAAAFEHKAAALGTVTPMQDTDGVWRVAGYYIK